MKNDIGKMLEYIHLIPKGLPNSIKILKGMFYSVGLFYNLIGDEKKQVINNRRLICIDCPYNSYLAKNSKDYFNLFNKNYKTNRKDLHCSFCGCPIKIRTASLDSSCAIEEWNTETQSTLTLKWEKYG